MTIGKTKFEYEINEFNKAFHEMKNKNIVLYGTGRMTATLLEADTDFCIIGVTDRDESLIGTKVYGKPVLSQEEVEREADILIINTAESYWNTIYQRIKNWNIPIYYRNGVRAVDIKNEYQNNVYWNKSIEQLKDELKKYEVVTFDIFDTLIMRRCCFPLDIFNLLENQLNELKGEETFFTTYRKRASGVLENPTFEEIYEKIQELSGWDADFIDVAKKMEFELESKFLIPRSAMMNLYHEMLEEKEVYLVSDMYFTSEQIIELLRKCGIRVEKQNLFVSCEKGGNKKSGSLWKLFAETVLKGRHCLHIGDDKQADEIMPQKFGIDTYAIKSALEILELSSIGAIVPQIETLYSSIAIGEMIAVALNNPFVLNDTKGKIVFQSKESAGLVIWGNVINCFFSWIIKRVHDKIGGVRHYFFWEEKDFYLPNYLKNIVV